MTKVKLQLGAELDLLSPAEMAAALDQSSRWERQAAFGLRHQDLPRMIGTPAAGVLNLGADQADQVFCGPKNGWYWSVTRISADGLSAGGGASSSVTNNATITSSAQAIASIALNPGTYTVYWEVGISGTSTAADDDNTQLLLAGTQIAVSDNTSGSGVYAQTPQQIVVPAGGATLAAESITGGSGTAVYRVQITAVPAGADVLKLYKGAKFLGILQAVPGFVTFPKGAAVFKAGDFLRATGTGLLATGQIEIYGEALSAPGPMMWKILS